jgi:hypothetical protein
VSNWIKIAGLLSLCGDGLADCDKSFPGTFSNNQDTPRMKEPDKDAACSYCHTSEKRCDGLSKLCSGDHNTTDCVWAAGSGDIIRGPGQHSSGLGLHSGYVPNILLNGTLEGKHVQLDLGRPGQCAADVFVSLLGMALEGERAAGSVGQCCDRCTKADRCKGWVMDGDTRSCSLLGTQRHMD